VLSLDPQLRCCRRRKDDVQKACLIWTPNVGRSARLRLTWLTRKFGRSVARKPPRRTRLLQTKRKPVARKPRTLAPEQVLLYFLKDLGELELYIAFQQRWQDEEQARYAKYLRHEDDSTDDAERYDYRQDHYARLHNSFPQMSRQMAVVYAFSALEDTLTEFCFAVQRVAALPAPTFGTNGSALEHVKGYLKQTRIGFPAGMAFWPRIKAAQRVRNMLAHGLGHLDAEPSTHEFVRTQIERSGRGIVERYARDQMHVNEKFMSELVISMRALCNELCDRYLATYGRP
jgi:hypothetical protein